MNGADVTRGEPKPSVSVIIPVYNDHQRLAVCLEALQRQDYAGSIEILVVDNGSDELPRVPAGVELLQEVKPGSYNARNKGLEIACGDILAFTDSDCIPEPSWLTAGVKALTSDGRIGLVGGRIDLFASSGRSSIPELLELAVAFPQERYVTHGNFAATANMLTRRTVVQMVGNFNGALRSGGDSEFGQRVADAGFRLIYAAEACVKHPARSEHLEIMAKMRRTTGGQRDRRPGWPQALAFVGRSVRPQRSMLRAALRLREVPLSKRLLVAAYAHYVSWNAAAYRLKLQLTSSESSR